MKKRIIIAGCFVILAALAAIWVLPPVAEPLELPESDQLRSVTLSYEGSSVVIEDAGQREELMEQLRSARPTRLQSVNDTPAADELFRLEIEDRDGGIYTLFVYTDGDDSHAYAELPYQGIYRIDDDMIILLRSLAG